MTECRGYDVSQFQAPIMPHWQTVSFGIARASYGNRIDGRCIAHTEAMRAGRAKVGLYHFFCATVPKLEQLAAFRKIWNLVKPDLIGWVDVENYPGHTIGPADVKPLLEFLDPFASEFGGTCGLYLSRADWIRLGKPASLPAYKLWVPHWPSNGSRSRLASPATPGNAKPALWQCMVGPQPWGSLQNTKAGNAIDQDVAPDGLASLLLDHQSELEETTRWEDLSDADWHSHHFGRDHSDGEEESPA